MPVESAIIAHAGDLVAPLLVEAAPLSTDSKEAALIRLRQAGQEDRKILQRSFQRAEALALVSLCDETLWSDYGLQPTLRDEMLGPELASVAHRVLRSDGVELREIRARVQRELDRLKKAPLEEADFAGGSSIDWAGFRASATVTYLSALESWIAPQTLPKPLRQRIQSTWFARFSASLHRVLQSDSASRAVWQSVVAGGDSNDAEPLASGSTEVAGEEKRLEELERQTWRLDEVFGRLDKWVQANPNTTPTAAKVTGAPVQKRLGRLAVAVVMLAGVVTVLAVAWWIASGASAPAREMIARVHASNLHGLPERIARTAAWYGPEPLPGDVFSGEAYLLQESEMASEPITDEALNGAFGELQQKQLVHAALSGWVFNPVISEKFRTPGTAGEDWWNRAATMAIKAAPAEDDADATERWRNLLPHVMNLFESGKGKPALLETFLQLIDTLSQGLMAIRSEPGRRPVPAAVSEESDQFQKTVNAFVDSATKYFEQETKNLELKYGRFSPQMVSVHRLLAELSWRARESKKEQDSWVRAIRTVEKLEPRDISQLAFLNLRLGLSRAVATDTDGAEEAFASALQALRERHGEMHPEISRAERQIARIYADLGQFKFAWLYFEKALDMELKIYPVPTSEIAAMHDEQGQFLLDYGQFAPAIAVMQKGIEMWEKIEYPTSPSIAQAYRSLANAQVLAGQLAEAEKNQRKQAELYRAEYGASSMQVRDAEFELAASLLDLNDPAKAEEAGKLLESRIRIPLGAPFPDDAETALVRAFFARSLVLRGKPGEAVAQFDRAIDVLLDTQTRPSLAVATSLRDYGQALSDVGKRSDAVKRLADAEAELVSLNKSRPRYTKIASRLIDDIRGRVERVRADEKR